MVRAGTGGYIAKRQGDLFNLAAERAMHRIRVNATSSSHMQTAVIKAEGTEALSKAVYRHDTYGAQCGT